MQITKFLRYPGSKRRMIAFLMQYLPQKDEIGGCYIEPFVGSGAVYFMVAPKRAILSDVNPDLINLFIGIKKHPQDVWKIYSQFGTSKRDYEKIRRLPTSNRAQDKAARVLFLNRTCFKGMWRTNKKGMFNVGYGGQDRRWAINEQNLLQVSQALRTAQIQHCDFEETILRAERNDFIFLDPPYKPGLKEATNDHYTSKEFTFDDQKRLSKILKWATKNKIQWAMTNTSHRDVVKLYRGCYRVNFPKGTGNLPGLLVAKSGEVLITNYPLEGGKRIS